MRHALRSHTKLRNKIVICNNFVRLLLRQYYPIFIDIMLCWMQPFTHYPFNMDIRRMLFELPSSQNALKRAEFYMKIIQSLIEFIGQFDARHFIWSSFLHWHTSNILIVRLISRCTICVNHQYYRLFILRIKFDLDINLFHYY